jgi:hypothetical protein
MEINPKLLQGLGLVVLLSTVIVSCGGGSPTPVYETIQPSLSSGSFTYPVAGLQPTLLSRYFFVSEGSPNNGKIKLEAQYWSTKYQPRFNQFPGFAGWDQLDVPGSDSTRTDWLHLSLNRDATLAVVWKKTAPWLSSWTKGTSPLADGSNTYTKSFAAGEIMLPSPGKDNGKYLVLIAEKDAKPSAVPGLPAGVTAGTPIPTPNEICPSWVDNLYSAQAPDGQTYLSWHPQIDPVYWCYFRHEHGSDPSLIGLPGIPLEYVAKVNGNQAEVHEGFKGFAIRDQAHGYGWYFNVHAETGDLHRVCTRKHTVTVSVTKLDTGELVAQLGYKGDFGASIGNRDVGDKAPIIQTPNMPGMTCDDQAAILEAEPNFAKRIRIASIENGGYENWHGGLNSTLGLTAATWFKEGMIVDIRNPGTSCPDVACTTMVPNNSHGDNRAIILYQSHLKYSSTNDTLNGSAADGVFYTDVYGTTLFDSPGAGRVKQFIKPGLSIDGPDGGYNSEDAWRGLYVEGGNAPNLELEDALGATN